MNNEKALAEIMKEHKRINKNEKGFVRTKVSITQATINCL